MFLDCVGSISHWAQIPSQKNLKIKLNHSFQKQSSLSQFEIVGPNGRIKLSVPTVKKSRKGPFADVLISYDSPWQTEHWKSIESAYLKSPFFIYYNYKLEPVFRANYRFLFEFNKAMFDAVIDCLKLRLEVEWDMQTAVYYKETEEVEHAVYPQVFDNRRSFQSNLSVLDALFNLGPETATYLASISTE